MRHAAEGGDRNSALYLIARAARTLIADRGVWDAKRKCSSTTVGDDLRLVLWQPAPTGAQMLAIYDGGQTVLSCHLDHPQPQGAAKNYYPKARVLVSTWHRGSWQARLFDEQPVRPTPMPQKPGLRLVHSRDD